VGLAASADASAGAQARAVGSYLIRTPAYGRAGLIAAALAAALRGGFDGFVASGCQASGTVDA
jgi:hypothetical protein